MIDANTIIGQLRHAGVRVYCLSQDVVDNGALMIVPDHSLKVVTPGDDYVRIGDIVAFVEADLSGQPAPGVYCHAKVQSVQKANGRFRLIIDRHSRQFYEIKPH